MTGKPEPVAETGAGDQELLRRAEQALRKLSKAMLVVAPTLKRPYPDAPDTSPWDRFVHAPASVAYDLAHEIRATLAAPRVDTAPTDDGVRSALAELVEARAQVAAVRALCQDAMKLPTLDDRRPADDRISPRAVLAALAAATSVRGTS